MVNSGRMVSVVNRSDQLKGPSDHADALTMTKLRSLTLKFFA